MSSMSSFPERLGVTAVILSMTGAGFAACSRMTAPAQQESPVMATITSKDGTRIAYSRSGSGPPLVLVHGTTADHTRWARVLPELEPHFTVYAMDRRGRGGSGDAADYAIEREFEDVAAVVDAIGDPSKITYARLLDVFWKNIDPVTPNRQFCDIGTQYRSAIYYHDEEQKRLAEASKKVWERSARFQQPIVTEIAAASPFYRAEEYHQDYYQKNPIRFRFYKYRCGRDQRLEELWGRSSSR
jgi:peptide-methionine (S)-S-oxide reductase